jgi:YegS/Rv2252/BmrU family lipid kinase
MTDPEFNRSADQPSPPNQAARDDGATEHAGGDAAAADDPPLADDLGSAAASQAKETTAAQMEQAVSADVGHGEPAAEQTGDPRTADVILFISPKAGSGASREQIPRFQQLLDQAAITHALLVSPDTLQAAVQSRREQGQSQPVVIAIGGDGTLSLVAANSLPETTLIPMPMGTENLLSRHYGQTNQAEAVFKTLQHGRVIQIDAGEANGRLFLIMATAGFDAEVVRRLHLRRKGHIWRVNYFMPILQTLRRYRFPKLSVTLWNEQDEMIEQENVGWAMAFNLPCYAATMKIAPDAVPDDGVLDAVTFGKRGVFNGLRYVAGVFAQVHKGFPDVCRSRVSRIRIEASRRVAYELDGDYVGSLPLVIRVIPNRVRLKVPAR